LNKDQFFKERLVSLDIFRGATIAAMILVNNPGDWGNVYTPFLHAKWHGWTFTDLIFPFFLFIVGVAVVYALSKQVEKELAYKIIYKKIIRRTLILFFLGLFLNGFPFFEISTLRIPGVLQRIAICYLFSSMIFLHTKIRGQVLWAGGLLLFYLIVMEFIPVPGIEAGSYARGANLANYLDGFLGGHVWKYSAPWDPEGILSTLPAISTTLFGVLTGHFLKSSFTQNEKTILMLITGNAAILIGTIWHTWHPINKQLWTGSYAVLMAGLALVTLGTLYYITDIKKFRRFTTPFIVYGANAIAVYVLSGIVARLLTVITFTDSTGSTISLKTMLYETLFLSWLSDYNASLTFAFAFICIMYIAMWVLYKKKIFIKI